MRKLIEKLCKALEGGLRKACGRITPGKRLAVIITIVVVFAVLNIWITFRAIHSIGREDARRDVMKITPIEVPDFEYRDEEPSELQCGIEEYFKQNFNTEDNDTNDTEQGQTER